MMNINLAKGCFHAIEGHDVITSPFYDFTYPTGRFRFEAKPYFDKLPPIDSVYGDMVSVGWDESRIIDTLVDLYFPMRFFKVGQFENIVLCIGFIGMRGSGKSAGASIVASCDFLLRNKPVWSNVPIEIRVVYKDAEKIYRSMDLDELDLLDLDTDFSGGCLFYDEINMEAAEATRYSSGANLQFSYLMQQIRKRDISVLWTCQGWNWIDNRLRWQTDYVVACRDASVEKKFSRPGGIGENAVWRVHDLSGLSGKFDYDYELKHKFITDYVIGTHIVYQRPWWTAYETGLLQGERDYVRDYKITVQEKIKAEREKLTVPVNTAGIAADLPENSETIRQFVQAYVSIGATKITCNSVWQRLGDIDRSTQVQVGNLFKEAGYRRKGNSKSGYYWQKENE